MKIVSPYFCIRSGNLIKIDQTNRLTADLFPHSPIHYFNNYRDAYHYTFGQSFATSGEKLMIQHHQLDLVAYTDGGQRNDNDGAWAYSINDAQKQLTFNARYFNTKNNNYCELEAVIETLNRLIKIQKSRQRIQIDTDSGGVSSIIQNLRRGISIQSIARNTEWQMAQLRKLKRALHHFSHLRIKQIKGHSGILGNQLVHQLCSRAMSTPYSNGYDPFRINRIDYLKTRLNQSSY